MAHAAHTRRAAVPRLASAALLWLALLAAASARETPPGAAPPHAYGPEGAPVTVEIFNDYQCPACATMNTEVAEFERKYAGRVRVVFRNFPLPMHNHAQAAARAAEAAAAQGKFREMLELLYAGQGEWAAAPVAGGIFASYVLKLGLDLRRFKSDSESAAVAERVKLDFERGRALNVKGTPMLYVNGVTFEGLPKRAEIHAAIEKALTPGASAQARAARAERPAPRFEDYPAGELYKGPIAPVRLDSRKARAYRTRLREDSRGGPNFAGRYTVVIWGCGTGCAQMGVVDAVTGRVYFPPVEYMDILDMDDEAERSKWFRPDSKLLRVTRDYYDGRGGYKAYYFLFDRGRFRLLREADERHPPDEETEN
jgi:protein-disulfide isomerase